MKKPPARAPVPQVVDPDRAFLDVISSREATITDLEAEVRRLDGLLRRADSRINGHVNRLKKANSDHESERVTWRNDLEELRGHLGINLSLYAQASSALEVEKRRRLELERQAQELTSQLNERQGRVTLLEAELAEANEQLRVANESLLTASAEKRTLSEEIDRLSRQLRATETARQKMEKRAKRSERNPDPPVPANPIPASKIASVAGKRRGLLGFRH